MNGARPRLPGWHSASRQSRNGVMPAWPVQRANGGSWLPKKSANLKPWVGMPEIAETANPPWRRRCRMPGGLSTCMEMCMNGARIRALNTAETIVSAQAVASDPCRNSVRPRSPAARTGSFRDTTIKAAGFLQSVIDAPRSPSAPSRTSSGRVAMSEDNAKRVLATTST